MWGPFIRLLGNVISLYELILIAWIILSILESFGIVNRHHPFVSRVMYVLRRLTEPVLQYFRRFIPSIGGIDLSPIAVFILLSFLKDILYSYFY